MEQTRLTHAQIASFWADGYVIVRQLFSTQQMDILLDFARSDPRFRRSAAHIRDEKGQINYGDKLIDLKDAQGGQSKLYIDYDLREGDLYAAIARSQRIVGPMEQVFSEPVNYFHHKMMLKEPFVGGAWEWHQDYGYWYEHEGFMKPDMASCLIAVDRANRQNGCLQVIGGSHKLGRMNHGMTGDQAGADLQRVEAALRQHTLVYCEMEPGDALFFHGNTLHRSDQNKSPHSRWSLICCYSTVSNYLCKPADHINLVQVEPWDDARVFQTTQCQTQS